MKTSALIGLATALTAFAAPLAAEDDAVSADTLYYQFEDGTLVALEEGDSIPSEPAQVDTDVTDAGLEKRQSVGSTANELVQGACRDVTFIFARGSTEPGNLGSTVGPATCRALKNEYGSSNVACQGVGSPYEAGIITNTLPAGATRAAIGEARRLIELANSKCPNSLALAGGYSQGGAVIRGGISTASAAARDNLAGALTFGDTRNLQERGEIDNYPDERFDSICIPGDTICAGTLIVTAAHLAYLPTVPQAARFLQGRIAAAS